MSKLESMEELQDEEVLCDYCSCTDYGNVQMSSEPNHFCEGINCNEAYQNYLDDMHDRGEED